MPAGQFTLYRANLDDLSMADIAAAVVKVALVTSVYAPNAANNGHTLWAEVSADEIANGNGYATGGFTLTDSVALATNGHMYASDDPTWTAAGGSIPAWRYGVMYLEGTVAGMVNPLVGYFLGDTTPADVPATSDGNPLTITVPAEGWFTATQAP